MRDSRLITLQSFFSVLQWELWGLKWAVILQASYWYNAALFCESWSWRQRVGCGRPAGELAKITVTLRPFHTCLVLQQLWEGNSHRPAQPSPAHPIQEMAAEDITSWPGIPSGMRQSRELSDVPLVKRFSLDPSSFSQPVAGGSWNALQMLTLSGSFLCLGLQVCCWVWDKFPRPRQIILMCFSLVLHVCRDNRVNIGSQVTLTWS